MRTETERPKAVEAGTVKVAGVRKDAIFNLSDELLSDPEKYSDMAKAVNPYGGGRASERIMKILLRVF